MCAFSRAFKNDRSKVSSMRCLPPSLPRASRLHLRKYARVRTPARSYCSTLCEATTTFRFWGCPVVARTKATCCLLGHLASDIVLQRECQHILTSSSGSCVSCVGNGAPRLTLIPLDRRGITCHLGWAIDQLQGPQSTPWHFCWGETGWGIRGGGEGSSAPLFFVIPT